MRSCVACRVDHDGTRCPQCGFEPTEIAGRPAFSPELALAGGGYDAELFGQLAPLEPTNFWFQARNDLITSALAEHVPQMESFLEIGCGTGFVLSGVATTFPRARLAGSEIFAEGLEFAAERVPGVDLMQMDARQLPFTEEFDVVGAFDVLEHIEEDEEVLAEVHRTLRPDGCLVLTVPQHRWMWSPADDHAHHVRRYTRRELHSKLSAAGYDVVLSTSFVSLLLPAMLLSRLVEKASSTPYDPVGEMTLPPALNRIFALVMRVEHRLISWGVRLPVGGSRLVVARRRG